MDRGSDGVISKAIAVEYLQQKLAETQKAERCYREGAETWRDMTPETEREGRRITKAMTGRSTPRTSSSERLREAEKQERCANRLKAECETIEQIIALIEAT
jgi:hypothetical protein